MLVAVNVASERRSLNQGLFDSGGHTIFENLMSALIRSTCASEVASAPAATESSPLTVEFWISMRPLIRADPLNFSGILAVTSARSGAVPASSIEVGVR